MLNDISIKVKLMIFPILFIGLFITSGLVYSYYKNLALSRNEIALNIGDLNNQLLKGRISVYQFLRNPNNDAAQKVREDFILLKKNALQIKNHLSLEENKKHIDVIESLTNEYIEIFDKFSTLRVKDFSNNIKDESSEIKPAITNMVKIGVSLENELMTINQSACNLRDIAFDKMNNMISIIGLFSIIIFIILSMYIYKSIASLLNLFQNGLFSFFSYLNKETNNVELIKINSKDEFGNMSKIVNNNIEKIEHMINQDNQLIDDAKVVMSRVNNGWYSQFIEKSTSNTSLEEFKNNVNEMIKSTRQRFVEIDEILEEYAKHNYLPTLVMKPSDERGGLFERLVLGINTLQNSITQMLVENKSNGLTLDQSSNILLSNVDKLNVSSNEAAASLEETAAALEQITSNIRNNTENIAKMSKYSSSVTTSATNGEKLANQTTVAMDEINVQVNLINESISVIDQIAFQTNILSLNAAVEAATAGEAGKGFAVVAQEVRNLASRSAEAAKEIKNIVENAKNKADEGKEIAGHMIDGYKELNESIQQTINLISDIEMSSKEQLSGIEQINDAVTQLDQQTQQNAAIASETHNVAVVTDEIAKLVVSNANEKEFKGKNEVKGRSVNIKAVTTSYEVKTNHTPAKKISTPLKHIEPKVTSHKTDEDEWESF